MGIANRFPWGSRRRASRGEALPDRLFRGLVFGCALAVSALLVVFVLVLFRQSWPTITAFGWGFLFSSSWNTGAVVGSGQSYGALPFVYGTLVTAAIAMLLGIPLSIGIAIFVSELAPPWVKTPLAVLVELLAAVPSVVYGLWGFLILGPTMRTTIEPPLKAVLGWTPLFGGPIFGIDYLTAGVILAIMVIPTISAVTRESMSAVPEHQREAALSLGATRWETTRLGVLSYARVGIFGAIILGLGRAVGETMAVTMTIGNSNTISGSLLAPGQTIASLIANEFGEASGLQVSALLELGLVLLLIAIAINVVARLLTRRIFQTEATTL